MTKRIQNLRLSSPIKTQLGVTLIVSLVILVALTLIGLSSMQGSRTEMAMAGNLRESDLTFQAAEVGIKSAEDYIQGTRSSAIFESGTVNGLWTKASDDPDYFDKDTWDVLAFTSPITVDGVKAPPQFVIKYLGRRSDNDSVLLNVNNIGGQQPGKIVSNFRSTARSVGRTGNSFRYMQSYFGIEY